VKRIFRDRVLLIGMAFMSLTLFGCSVHSVTYDKKPQIEVPDSFSEQKEKAKINQNVWWSEFQRPLLDDLISQSLSGNFEIMQALSRLQQARAIIPQTRSSLFPNVDVTGNADREWEGSEGQRGTAEIGGSLKWEIDIFNRISNAVRADRLEAKARLADVEALKLSLSADVANAYFGAVAAQGTLSLLNQQVQTDRELLDLLSLRFEEGVGTNVEVLQQESRVADSESLIPTAKADVRVFENRLDVLLGMVPDAQNRISNTETLDFTRTLPATGVPADLLINRPDLKSALAELVAADADIGVAIADRLPRIMLDGSYLFSDTASFTGPISSIMGSFVQPLLDWGSRKAEVERNKEIYKERLAAFTQQYLEAVEDVENTLYQENQQRDFIRRLEDRKTILQHTVDETEARYTQGIDDYLPVLNALQELRQVERDLIRERLNLVNFRIALHLAIGGTITPKDNPIQNQGETE
jgi:NodT family efflux transporter outer membrane factor (OMF) lipoprotein